MSLLQVTSEGATLVLATFRTIWSRKNCSRYHAAQGDISRLGIPARPDVLLLMLRLLRRIETRSTALPRPAKSSRPLDRARTPDDAFTPALDLEPHVVVLRHTTRIDRSDLNARVKERKQHRSELVDSYSLPCSDPTRLQSQRVGEVAAQIAKRQRDAS